MPEYYPQPIGTRPSGRCVRCCSFASRHGPSQQGCEQAVVVGRVRGGDLSGRCVSARPASRLSPGVRGPLGCHESALVYAFLFLWWSMDEPEVFTRSGQVHDPTEKSGVKTGQNLASQTGPRESPLIVVMQKRSLALPRLGPHRDVGAPGAPHGGAGVALVGPTPHRVARRVATRWGDAGTATLSRVDRSISSCLGRPWTSPRGLAPGSHTALRMSGPILRRPKDFVDQRQR